MVLIVCARKIQIFDHLTELIGSLCQTSKKQTYCTKTISGLHQTSFTESAVLASAWTKTLKKLH